MSSTLEGMIEEPIREEIKQLETLAQEVDVEFFPSDISQKPVVEMVEKGLLASVNIDFIFLNYN